MKIVLLGYMASGKSFIGKTLAQVLDFNFIDLDDYIVDKEEQSIKTIFEKKGEIYFRKIEHLALKELLLKEENIVLSLGGGTPCYSNNMDLLLNAKQVETIYLQVSIQETIARLQADTNKRPLISHLKNKEELIEFVGKHIFERSTFYNKATYKINADSSKKSIIESILLQLF